MSTSFSPPGTGAVIGVAALNRLARDLLERALPLMWVRGEISNYTRAPSGHCYFTLKDSGAQIRCAMFRNRARLIDWQPQDGMQVEVRALVTLYEARGEFQLNVEAIRRAGLGALYEAFERLKARLSAEGLFDPARKRPVPKFPRAVGVVTSSQAAALRDVLSILARRMPCIPVIIYPTAVQGAGAGQSIAEAVTTASQRAECDVLIVCRGGGSIEDLWAFNEEVVARAIFACAIPVVAGVGHETDFTIADFVADLRAPTPSAAAEAASPEQGAVSARLSAMHQRLSRSWSRRTEAIWQMLDYLGRRLVDPRERLRADARHLRHLVLRMVASASQWVAAKRWLLTDVERRMAHARLDTGRQVVLLQQLQLRLEAARTHAMRDRSSRVEAAAARLETLNPHAVLARGYAIATDGSGCIVRDAARLAPGDTLGVRLAHGRVDAEVRSVLLPDSGSEPAAGAPRR